MSEQRPHVKARALCLLGDLKGSGPHPDYKQALQLHTQALQAADALISDKHPAIRVAAKEVLLDAHLGALHDISWGAWREKERSAENWIAKATEIAQDLIKTEDGSDEYLFRVSTRALSADVGLQGKLDPAKWAKEVVRSGEVLISAAPEPARKAELQWQVAMSLYDAMQVYQMRPTRTRPSATANWPSVTWRRAGGRTSRPRRPTCWAAPISAWEPCMPTIARTTARP